LKATRRHLEGELAHFGVQADYLFGSPMAGRQLRVTATRQRHRYQHDRRDRTEE
jgi:hypothetical protein